MRHCYCSADIDPRHEKTRGYRGTGTAREVVLPVPSSPLPTARRLEEMSRDHPTLPSPATVLKRNGSLWGLFNCAGIAHPDKNLGEGRKTCLRCHPQQSAAGSLSAANSPALLARGERNAPRNQANATGQHATNRRFGCATAEPHTC